MDHNTQSDATEKMLNCARSTPDDSGNSSNSASEALRAVRVLWNRVADLVGAAEASCVDIGLQRECQQLLTACDELVAEQEALGRLCDLSAVTDVSDNVGPGPGGDSFAPDF